MNDKKETFGKQYTDFIQNPDCSQTLEDSQEKRDKDYIENVLVCIERHKKLFPGDFYPQCMIKAEPLMPGTFVKKHYATIDCPTPTWNQTVYKYHRQEDRLEFLWTVPDPQTCQFLRKEALLTPPEERELVRFVLEFEDGTLDKKCYELNNYLPDAIITTPKEG